MYKNIIANRIGILRSILLKLFYSTSKQLLYKESPETTAHATQILIKIQASAEMKKKRKKKVSSINHRGCFVASQILSNNNTIMVNLTYNNNGLT